jgi:hypothetical protein
VGGGEAQEAKVLGVRKGVGNEVVEEGLEEGEGDEAGRW